VRERERDRETERERFKGESQRMREREDKGPARVLEIVVWWSGPSVLTERQNGFEPLRCFYYSLARASPVI
jgi:hypothetical protein